MKKLKVYIDTSVVGGCLDEEFSAESRALLDMASHGEITLAISALLLRELEEAPAAVIELLQKCLGPSDIPIPITVDAERLQQAYLTAGVVGAASANDALHVALATVDRADVIASWNFKHLVHLEKIRGFNAVNFREGYGLIEIRSPKELVIL